ncbi:hypothetical protein Vretimale_3052, partial [Volvox reticuliferus]
VSPLLPKFLKLSGTRGAPASSAPINSVNGTASELNRNGSGSNHSNPCSAAAGSGGKLQTRCRSSGCTVRRGCRRFARLLNGSGNGSGSRAVSASASKTSATMRRTTAPRQAASFSISPGGRYSCMCTMTRSPRPPPWSIAAWELAEIRSSWPERTTKEWTGSSWGLI